MKRLRVGPITQIAMALALMACMRRVHVILNTMMKTGRHWEVPTPSTP